MHMMQNIKLKANLRKINIYAFCGKIGCSIGLELTSGKGRNANYGPKSDCKLLINKFMGIFY